MDDTFKITLQAARVNSGKRQKEVAKEIGVSLVTLSNWERRRTSPPIDKAEQLAKLYGIPLDRISFFAS